MTNQTGENLRRAIELREEIDDALTKMIECHRKARDLGNELERLLVEEEKQNGFKDDLKWE